MRIAIVIQDLVLARAKRRDVQFGRAWILVQHSSAFICGCLHLRLFPSAAVSIRGCFYPRLFDLRHLRPTAAASGGGI